MDTSIALTSMGGDWQTNLQSELIKRWAHLALRLDHKPEEMFVYINLAFDISSLEQEVVKLMKLEKHRAKIEDFQKKMQTKRIEMAVFPKFDGENLNLQETD